MIGRVSRNILFRFAVANALQMLQDLDVMISVNQAIVKNPHSKKLLLVVAALVFDLDWGCFSFVRCPLLADTVTIRETK